MQIKTFIAKCLSAVALCFLGGLAVLWLSLEDACAWCLGTLRRFIQLEFIWQIIEEDEALS